jgi:hypothetical protein
MSIAEVGAMIPRSLPLILLLSISAACGGSSPTSPGETGNPGATISGSVLGGGSNALTAASGGHAVPGLIVTVLGTSISSGLDAAGRFNLKGVPSGDVQLQFSGPVTGVIGIDQVRSDENITLVIGITGSTITVQAQMRSHGQEEQLEGLIESVPPTMPAGSIKVAGRTVITDASTEIRHGSTPYQLDELEVGYRVHVKGQTTGGELKATSIFVQNTNTAEDEPEDDQEQDSSASIHGEVMQIGGSFPAFQLIVGTTIVRTSSNTEVKRRGDVQTLNELRIGMDVHVIGVRQPDGSIDARRIEINDDETGGEVEISGSAGGVSGTCPTLTFGINGYSIRTTASTTFDGITCAAMKSGTKVTVKGISQPDNSVVATSVKAN